MIPHHEYTMLRRALAQRGHSQREGIEMMPNPRFVAFNVAAVAGILLVGSIVMAASALAHPAADDPLADWHWLDMQIEIGMAALVLAVGMASTALAIGALRGRLQLALSAGLVYLSIAAIAVVILLWREGDPAPNFALAGLLVTSGLAGFGLLALGRIEPGR